MQSLNNYINESIDNSIFEGFIDKLKRGIEDIIDNPKPYIEDFRKNLEKTKQTKYFKYVDIKNPEGFAKALDKLNDDEMLRKIYKWVVKIINDGQEGDNRQLYRGITGYDYSGMNGELQKSVKDEFGVDDEKDHNMVLAIINVGNAMAITRIKNDNAKKDNSNSNSGHASHHSSYGSRRVGASCGAAAVAIAMR